MVLKEAYGAITRPKQTTQIPFNFPVPLKGVNAVSAFSGLLEDEAHYLYNILPTEQGLAVRQGFQEYSNDTGYEGRTTITFVGSAAAGTNDKIFVTGDDGIYEMTAGAGNATKVFTFSTTGTSAGYGVYIQWTAANGNQYIQYADSANGLIEYDASGDSWAAVTSITGLTETDIRFVMVHKLRIWYIVDGDPNAYYLPVSAKTGAATQFQLGSKFMHGGDCAGLYNMTHDAGDGLDDFFIAISRDGDVLVYQGTDPSSASTWGIKGRFQVGAIPTVSRKFGCEVEGDVLILSSLGLSSVKNLIQGREEFSVDGRNPTDKISNTIRNRMMTELGSSGWEVMVNGSINSVIIQTPERQSSPDQWTHYVYNLATKAWGSWRGVNSLSMGMLRNVMYFAADDGAVWYMNGYEDNVTIADAANDSRPVDFSMLTAYSNGGYPGAEKRGGIVKPIFQGTGLVDTDSAILYDYNFIELSAVGVDGTFDEESVWDTAEWDTAIWGGNTTYRGLEGTLGDGMGVVFGVAIRGKTRGKLTLMELPCTFEPGGMM
jgi:hypothetical protein